MICDKHFVEHSYNELCFKCAEFSNSSPTINTPKKDLNTYFDEVKKEILSYFNTKEKIPYRIVILLSLLDREGSSFANSLDIGMNMLMDYDHSFSDNLCEACDNESGCQLKPIADLEAKYTIKTDNQ